MPRAYAALLEGEVAGCLDRMANNVTVACFGDHGLISLTVSNTNAEGDQVFVEARGQSGAKDGRSYNNPYGIAPKPRDGRIAEICDYMDTQRTRSIFG